MPLAIYGGLESDFDAAVALAVLVLGASRSPLSWPPGFHQEGGRRRGLSYALVGEDHDIRSLDEGGYLFAGFKVELLGALAGDEGDHVVISDLEGYLGRRFPLYHLGDSAG